MRKQRTRLGHDCASWYEQMSLADKISGEEKGCTQGNSMATVDNVANAQGVPSALYM